MTTSDSDSYSEEIPTLVVIFVGATVTVLILVLMMIIVNTMKRRISDKKAGSHESKKLQVLTSNTFLFIFTLQTTNIGVSMYQS